MIRTFVHNLHSYLTVLLTVVFVLLSLLLSTVVSAENEGHPRTANYYLGQLQYTESFINRMADYDLLILTPAQMKYHRVVVKRIREKNPDIIMLAYVPSQSYNHQYWPDDVVFRRFHVQDNWWLKDDRGKIISSWPGIYNTNMSTSWSKGLIDFTDKYITSIEGVDGIFFDMVSHNISWINNGNLDLDGNGRRDQAATADKLWLDRTEYFFEYAKQTLDTEFIVMNGSSHPSLQTHVHGRMFETFPTPWEEDGSWSTVMRNLERNKTKNLRPYVTILNSNTENTGNKNDFQRMRFGLTSALLSDSYFSFDYGDQDHSQLWWYDEFDTDLGDAIDEPVPSNGGANFSPDVWQRQFEQGLAIVNSTNKSQSVSLDGEYEKIHGTQDLDVNDGSIVSEIDIDSEDGIVLLKTFQTPNNILYKNGAFLRFFRPDSSRVRNGFFAFDPQYDGGDYVARVDVSGNEKKDSIRLSKNKLEVYRYDGQRYMKRYPYKITHDKDIRIAIGDLDGDDDLEIVIAPGPGSSKPIQVYSHTGTKLYKDWYPLGAGYQGGYDVTIAREAGKKDGYLVVAAGTGRQPQVRVYEKNQVLLRSFLAYESRFRGGVHVTAGDLDGDGTDELITGPGKGGKTWVKTFSLKGVHSGVNFQAYESFSFPGVDVEAVDVDFDGKEDIVTISEGIGF